MKAIVQLVIRQSGCLSGFLALSFLLLALMNGGYVCQGLWQGTGLHGYTTQMNNKYGFSIVLTWDAFVQMFRFISLAVLFGLITLWRSGMIGFGKAGIVENPGKGNVLRTHRNTGEAVAITNPRVETHGI